MKAKLTGPNILVGGLIVVLVLAVIYLFVRVVEYQQIEDNMEFMEQNTLLWVRDGSIQEASIGLPEGSVFSHYHYHGTGPYQEVWEVYRLPDSEYYQDLMEWQTATWYRIFAPRGSQIRVWTDEEYGPAFAVCPSYATTRCQVVTQLLRHMEVVN